MPVPQEAAPALPGLPPAALDYFYGEQEASWATLQEALQQYRHVQEQLFCRMAAFANAPKASEPSPDSPPPLPTTWADVPSSDDSPAVPECAAMGCGSATRRWRSWRTGSPEKETETPPIFERGSTSSRGWGARGRISEQLDELMGMSSTASMRKFTKHPRKTLRFFFLRGWQWWLGLEEPERTGRVADFVRSERWESMVSALILVNSVLMAVMVDSAISRLLRSGDDSLGPTWLFVEFSFIIFFAIELGLRLFVHRLYFFINRGWAWNNFDFVIVIVSMTDTLSQVFEFLPGSLNTTFLRCIRTLRLVRSLRIVRVFKYAGSLRRMLLSLMGSVVPLFWSLVLLWSVFYLFSLATVQGVSNFLASVGVENIDPDAHDDLLERFGSMASSMLSYYKALRRTGGVNHWMFLLAVAFTQIAVFNIMTGVFVENAFKNAQPDRQAMALEQRRKQANEADELHALLSTVDVDGTGTVSFSEFLQLADDPRLHSILEVMGLDIKDARLVHDMLQKAARCNEVSLEFLTDSLLRMKGPALSVDLHALMYKTAVLQERVDAMNDRSIGPTSYACESGAAVTIL